MTWIFPSPLCALDLLNTVFKVLSRRSGPNGLTCCNGVIVPLGPEIRAEYLIRLNVTVAKMPPNRFYLHFINNYLHENCYQLQSSNIDDIISITALLSLINSYTRSYASHRYRTLPAFSRRAYANSRSSARTETWPPPTRFSKLLDGRPRCLGTYNVHYLTEDCFPP